MYLIDMSDCDDIYVEVFGFDYERRIDKKTILSFSHVQQGQTLLVYGDRENPDSVIIMRDAEEFRHFLNGTLSDKEFKKLVKQKARAFRFGPIEIYSRVSNEREIAERFKKKHQRILGNMPIKIVFGFCRINKAIIKI